MAREEAPRKSEKIPPGFELLHALRGHGDVIEDVEWSPDGQTLASASADQTIRLWDGQSGELLRTLEGHSDVVVSVAWSPDGRTLASGSEDTTVRLWDVESGKLCRTLEGHDHLVISVAWSPDGRTLASGSEDTTVRLWDTQRGKLRQTLEQHDYAVWSVAWSPDGRALASSSLDETVCLWYSQNGDLYQTLRMHGGEVRSVAWSPDGQMLASGFEDNTVRLWDLEVGRQTSVLEGHTDAVTGVCFSSDGRLLASRSTDDTVRLWRCDTWEMVAILDEPDQDLSPVLAFCPEVPILATLSDEDYVIRIWRLDYEVLLGAPAPFETRHYRNAKAVLVGDTGVGKTGLGLVLTDQPWEPTESTHGRHVWTFDSREEELPGGRKETRETLLWDLAGQPGYRLIHRLHLHDVAVALVVFDARSETDPFAGVDYWARALDQATASFPTVKFLVAARTDRGGPPVSQERIQEVMDRFGFAAYFETSAKRGDGIEELKQAIQEAIRWQALPFVTTPEVFARIKMFLIAEKETGRAMSIRDNLLVGYQMAHPDEEEPEAAFQTCLGLLEAAGLIRQLSFEDLVLLQPEMLDNYCAALALAARDEPDGLGYISEARALSGDFSMDENVRIQDRAMEPSMLLATIQEAVGQGLAVRQATAAGEMLVFPSELRRDFPEYPGGRALAVTFLFDGPVSGIYATLTVSLIHSLVFRRRELYKNAALFCAPRDQECGFAVEYPDKYNDARGRLAVFFDDVEKDVQLLFLRYVNQQLEKLALRGTVRRERIYQCPGDGYIVPPDLVARRRQRGETTVICGDCGRHILLDDLAEEADREDKRVAQIEADSTEERERQKRLTILARREELQQYHTFLCHNGKDKPGVRRLGQILRNRGILAWIDEEGILAGDQFVPELEAVLDKAPSALVIVGPHWLGRWQRQEYYALLQRYVEHREEEGRRLRLIPVLLPGAPVEPDLPIFLRGFSWVDFRTGGLDDRSEMRRLVQAILSEGRKI